MLAQAIYSETHGWSGYTAKEKTMISPTKAVLLVLILFLSSYSQEQLKAYSRTYKDNKGCTVTERDDGLIVEMICPPPRIRSHPHITTVKEHKSRNDTLWIFHNETYVLYSMTLQEGWAVKINSVIRGNLDTANYLLTMRGRMKKNRCHGNEFEFNKDYVVLNTIEYGEKSGHEKGTLVSYSLYNCDDVFPDTPENRKKLIERYEKTVILKEPKPNGAKKE
jgi:hypothetical protein